MMIEERMELAKVYDPKTFEERIYRLWQENHAFRPQRNPDKSPFVIVIPPPNVTGILHMGHAVGNVPQDILTRYHRMQGRPTLWVPGADHAGIATQHVVEKRLRAEGLSLSKLGREAFLERAWEHARWHHDRIKKQQQDMGLSCDWERERFTLDEGLSRAVREVFVLLYQRGLLYRGEYLVNWCFSCGTALSDDEVDHKPVEGTLYHILYPFSSAKEGGIVIATTRPETLFGDVAVAVHPEDERYQPLLNERLMLPLTERTIPLITDLYSKREFGSGAVKVTPAHDPNDWCIGERHDLERINILKDDGTLNEHVPVQYQHLTVQEAREAVIRALRERKLLIREEKHHHQVGHCSRCETTIEPFVSRQWFVKMKPLAKKALSAWESDEIRFYPRKWENTYKHWMVNVRDWCISRQLWWGHQIPAWYCQRSGHVTVQREEPTECTQCGSRELTRDPDVLDTWFSSWLWPFSVLGWPEKTEDLATYFPTTTIVSGYDILFFWIARMVMASKEFLGKIPFRDIYLTPLLRDREGRKMSKSAGNGIDPLKIVDRYGADALTFTVSYISVQGQDILVDESLFKVGSKFCNKVWNAARYILMNSGDVPEATSPPVLSQELVDRWIYHRLNETVKRVAQTVAIYRFDEMTHAIYQFFWNDFCDWYLEITKADLYGPVAARKERAIALLLSLLEEILRLLHPFLPFLTEEIYGKLPYAQAGLLIQGAYPQEQKEREDNILNDHFEDFQALIQAIRTLRSEFTIPPQQVIDVAIFIEEGPLRHFLSESLPLVERLAQVRATLHDKRPRSEGAIIAVGKGFETFLYIRDLIDLPGELARLVKEVQQNKKRQAAAQAKLGNVEFLSKAPEEVVSREREKADELTGTIARQERYLRELRV